MRACREPRASSAGCGTRCTSMSAPGPRRDGTPLTEAQAGLRRQAHQALAKATDDIGRRHNFNTAIAAIMELLNAVQRFTDPTPQGRAVRHEALGLGVLIL